MKCLPQVELFTFVVLKRHSKINWPLVLLTFNLVWNLRLYKLGCKWLTALSKVCIGKTKGLTRDFTCGCVGNSAHVWTLVKKFLQRNVTQIPPGNRFTNHLTVISWKKKDKFNQNLEMWKEFLQGNVTPIPPGNRFTN